MSVTLDASDRKILTLIQQDATLTHQEIADRANLSSTSVWRRIKSLEEAGVIQGRVALLDAKQVGMQVSALVSVRLTHQGAGTGQEFETFIAGRPEVLECYAVVGNYDYAMIIRVPDVERFEKFLSGTLLSHPAVASSTSSFAMRQVKYSTALSLD
ncbi:Lrp/AsnC family transcriptional regulator [Emcibacter nanhaiensis]|uniref:Lrp/AsnC family transcriptional regulator n=1 Tax=Emcibacter nanhaiensis TaxID=1505037 RepID=A0A501PC92_9PROT|nr:Lrp/AsnC family transcriptional regulator [Emcibacter nanhaiensis]TPD57617.1 Lrp/AsnC family transcriptional regulator [Emcibacter nanhaiensis]